MKIRLGFVSNSSSSSFLIVNNDDLVTVFDDDSCVQLNDRQKAEVYKYHKDQFTLKDNVYLTTALHDSSALYDYIVGKPGVYVYDCSPFNRDEMKQIGKYVYMF